MTINNKPLVVIACATASGHTLPLLPHAAHLTKQGFEVSFISGPDFEKSIQKTGATFYPTENIYTAETLETLNAIPDGPARAIFDIKNNFINVTATRMKTLQTVLETLRETHPTREVVIVQELLYMGTWPYILGAPLPKGYDRFPRTIIYGTGSLLISSIDTAPFGPGLPPDSSEEGHARNAAMYGTMKEMNADLIDYANTVYAGLGATVKVTEPLFDFWTTGHGIMLQPCSPSVEYPRSDLSPKIRFIGGTPRREVDPSMALPSWWDELEANQQTASPKKVIFVTQGTFRIDYNELVIPTMQALADRDDVMVIGVLGVRNARLDGFEIPSNAKVVDYLLYDAVLPYVDVFVTNGGYGSFTHGIMNGVPMVMAGTGQDKAEVSMRVEWAGIGVNLRTDSPSQEAIREGVNKVLADPKYKARSLEIQRENEELDCAAALERYIMGAE
ncbi:UDP-Glycosyltransferase/glycogen phosphorylase [Aspergillus ibericus CBS 121593]|uniref:UDP-Glycosyltransferase/glycogen phosphorylase n=1 Tax=Aspergillus ibericus CBS 121593 TaxID=1448316 RepID=A0A395H7P3_9EURO|nr:UDP-Glycosyltransferase/glycogen phosphorylase [Aspergillus ibericus CBS 121593]RAL03680.1 UDP-Glycosyltransferase/glycogen phosphorylase [Aspergillus ibericus CBS 121593]